MARLPTSARCLLTATALLAATPALAGPRPTVLVEPFEVSGKAPSALGTAATLKAIGALQESGKVHLLHPKQYLRAYEHQAAALARLDAKSRRQKLGAALGAAWIVRGRVDAGADGLEVELSYGAAAGDAAGSAKLKAKTAVEALDALARELVAGMAKTGAFEAPAAFDLARVTPLTHDETALLEYAACFRLLIEQPTGIRQPVLLDAAALDEAVEHCEAAKRADGKLLDATAALGLAYALLGQRKSAEVHLAAVRDAPVFLPFYWIGKFWIVTRHYGVDAGLAVLQAAIAKEPGFLLARGYLGDTLTTLGRHDDALKVFQAYLDEVPNQPWVMGQLGYVTSKKGDAKAAIEWTHKALRVAPSDPELRLELASRMIDDGRLDDAIVVLKRLVDEGARGEVHLRLGYAQMLKGELATAERSIQQAIRLASRRSEWRTRGRARYDLAKIWMKQGVPDNALRQLRMAVNEGFRDKKVLESDPDLAPLKKSKGLAKAMRGDRKRRVVRPEYSSPFELDPDSGAITVGAGAGSGVKITF